MRALLVCLFLALPVAAAEPPKLADTFAMKNLVAWCIVPFDSQKRTPKPRVEMLQRLGFTQYAYDWRAEHLPSFPEEIELLKKAKISLKGVWFPANVGKDGEFILETLKKTDVKTELWVMLPQPKAESQDEKVKETAKFVTELAKRAAKQDCKIGIYNHGGWTGEPENMVAVVKASGEPNVGIVYNMHHGHSHMAKLDEYLKLMKSHLYCVNLNGMDYDADKNGRKIAIFATGSADGEFIWMLSATDGPFGILGHTDDDVEDRLHDNLVGLRFLTKGVSSDALQLGWPSYMPDYRTRGRIKLVNGAIEVINIPTLKANGVDFAKASQKELSDNFRVFVDQPEVHHHKLLESTPLAGELKFIPFESKKEFQQGKLSFTPRFPLEPGLTYRVILKGLPSQSIAGYYATFTIPNPAPEKPTTVDAVFPTSAKLPENALRMYLHFSAPMKQGFGHKYIRLTCDGKTVEDPYVHIEQELWSADSKRLTIIFDPARVKRGLKPREEAGPILLEGKKHTLTIDAAWPDAAGFPLKEKFTYSFDVGPPDETAIDPEKWTITPPTKETQLVVKFEKPLDKALAERLIWVVDPEGKRLELPSQTAKDQTGVTIGAAKTVWKPGNYKLMIDTRLEDICGNRVGEPFEVDEFKPVTKVVEGTTVERAFTVK